MIRVLVVGAVMSTVTVAAAADWLRFRGPNGTGLVADSAPLTFTLKDDLAWKTEIPGVGYGSPIVVKGKVYLQSAAETGNKRHLVCVDVATGKLSWTKDIDSPAPPGMHKKNTAASGTPASDGEHIFAAFWIGNDIVLHAFDLGGKPLWDTTLGKFIGQHGAAHSPMVFEDKVYFNLDQDGAAELIAVEAKTGKVAWRKTRKPNRASYTTPLILETKGKPTQLIVGSTTGVDSYDPRTGDSLWHYDIKWKPGGKELRAIGQQVIVNGNVVTYCGEGGADRYMVAVKTTGKGDVSGNGRAWEVNMGKTPYVPSMLVHQNALYWVTDQGLVGCADAKSGKVLWTDKVFEKAVSASPILIGDTILAVDEGGTVASFKVSPKGLGEVEKSTLGQTVLASPAAADGRLFIRGGKFLFCIGGKRS